jgi:hypothetical protein
MHRTLLSAVVLLCSTALACSGNVDDEDKARLAYLGLDNGIARAMQLGFDGFNAADSANIPTQTADGDVSGTMSISGQVDQGSSANKGMRLSMALDDYADDPVHPVDENGEERDEEYEIHYDTGSAVTVNFSLRDIPDGTMTGDISGTVTMTGDLEGELELNLSLDGKIEQDPDDATKTRRESGTTSISGTATSDFGEYRVDITR